MPTFAVKEPASRATVLARGDVGIASHAGVQSTIGGTDHFAREGGVVLSRVGPDGRKIYSLTIDDSELNVVLARVIVAKTKGVTPVRWTREAIANQLRAYAYAIETTED